MNGASPEVCESWVVACRRFLDDGRCPLGWPRRRTCNGRPLPRQRSSSYTAPTNTCSMQPPCPTRTNTTSSNSCSTNRENLPHDTPPNTGPPPSLNTIHRAEHLQDTHVHHRHRTHAHQHAPATSPHSPTPPSVYRYRQPPATACPLCARQRLPQTALPCNPDHWVCLGAAHRLTNCPHCATLNPHQRAWPAAPAAPASSGHAPTPSGTTLEGTTWQTRRTTHGP